MVALLIDEIKVKEGLFLEYCITAVMLFSSVCEAIHWPEASHLKVISVAAHGISQKALYASQLKFSMYIHAQSTQFLFF